MDSEIKYGIFKQGEALNFHCSSFSPQNVQETKTTPAFIPAISGISGYSSIVFLDVQKKKKNL